MQNKTSSPETVNLLLVDDRPENLMALDAVLEPLDAKLLSASSGEAALELARNHDFAAVLLDVQMPGMDGFETARRLRELQRASQVPVLFLTATEVDGQQIARGYALGAVDYILKPFTPDVLRDKVTAYIGLFHRTRHLQARLSAVSDAENCAHILVVNDDLAGLLATEASLEQLGKHVKVVLARSGQEALRLLLKQSFALILLDIHMPDMDGFELAAELRQNDRCRQIPLVFVTATTKAEADVTRGYACGAIDFLFVPIAPDLLRNKVNALLNQFRQQWVLTCQVDEIEHLNQNLRASTRELENINATLEQRVRERTDELVRTNEALQFENAERKEAEAALRQQTVELRARNDELAHFNRVVVGRELRMIELKQQVNELCRRLGEPPLHRMTLPPGDHVPDASPDSAPLPDAAAAAKSGKTKELA